jgi:hypothetical protein
MASEEKYLLISRITIRAEVFGAYAQPKLNANDTRLARLRTHLLPYISDSGARKRGWKAIRSRLSMITRGAYTECECQQECAESQSHDSGILYVIFCGDLGKTGRHHRAGKRRYDGVK